VTAPLAVQCPGQGRDRWSSQWVKRILTHRCSRVMPPEMMVPWSRVDAWRDDDVMPFRYRWPSVENANLTGASAAKWPDAGPRLSLAPPAVQRSTRGLHVCSCTRNGAQPVKP
jgi:hypothetical protein